MQVRCSAARQHRHPESTLEPFPRQAGLNGLTAAGPGLCCRCKEPARRVQRRHRVCLWTRDTIEGEGARRVEKVPGLQGCRGPQTEGKKSTAAQEERMRRLQEWRSAKGISYKRPPMPVRLRVRRTPPPPQPYWATMEQEDEARTLICTGCPPEQVTGVLSRLPTLAKKFSKYWICQARLMERQGNLDVLPMFEEAGEKGHSSAVKYKITATPGGIRSQQRERIRVDGQEVRFFTPVRRSVRIERASLGYPAFLREHDPCVASYQDLLAEEGHEGGGGEQGTSGGDAPPLTCTTTPLYVYRENEALQDQGCPPEQVTGVLSRLPTLAKKFSKYWICQARLMERQGNLDVLPMFEEAGEKGHSSAVKYKITATPGGIRSQQRERIRVDGQEVRFFTPVRRSVRIERASLGYPAFLREHDPCVASYQDLLAEEGHEGAGGSRGRAAVTPPSHLHYHALRLQCVL
ncbi:hypothetical protein CRUP_022962 [Coryphaenoides rupestris]|nr:hypothetical protein CRUP_022962 [Coryphaenoides rupestris]